MEICRPDVSEKSKHNLLFRETISFDRKMTIFHHREGGHNSIYHTLLELFQSILCLLVSANDIFQ